MSTAIIFGVSSLAISAFSAYNSISAADDASALRRQQDLKQSKYNLEKQKLAQLIQDRADAVLGVWTNHYLPVELATLDEVCSEPDEVAKIALVAQRARGEISKIFTLARKHQTFAVAPQQVGLRLESTIMLATKQADTIAGLIRTVTLQEHARVKLVNTQNLTNRMNMINPGRGHNAVVTSALAAAAMEYDRLSKEAAKNVDAASYVIGRSLSSALTSGQEVVKGFNTLNSSGAFRGAEQITKEPVYRDFFERQDARIQPLLVTISTSVKEEDS